MHVLVFTGAMQCHWFPLLFVVLVYVSFDII